MRTTNATVAEDLETGVVRYPPLLFTYQFVRAELDNDSTLTRLVLEHRTMVTYTANDRLSIDKNLIHALIVCYMARWHPERCSSSRQATLAARAFTGCIHEHMSELALTTDAADERTFLRRREADDIACKMVSQLLPQTPNVDITRFVAPIQAWVCCPTNAPDVMECGRDGVALAYRAIRRLGLALPFGVGAAMLARACGFVLREDDDSFDAPRVTRDVSSLLYALSRPTQPVPNVGSVYRAYMRVSFGSAAMTRREYDVFVSSLCLK